MCSPSSRLAEESMDVWNRVQSYKQTYTYTHNKIVMVRGEVLVYAHAGCGYTLPQERGCLVSDVHRYRYASNILLVVRR
jgi:hypothetical protein